MIECPVCGTANEDMHTTCVSCGSFVQGKVDALDLFHTLWGLIEAPRRTFMRIVLARHKNYVILLSALFGIVLVFDFAWYRSLGGVFGGLITLTGFAFFVGPFLGMLSLFLVSVALQQLTKVAGGHATLRNMYAVVSYATFPIASALVWIVPLELAVFGFAFFGTNPPPMIIKPAAYTTLIALKSVLAVYALYLLVEGAAAANGLSGRQTIPVVLSVLLVVGGYVTTLQWMSVR
ncbi:MAG: hypothetical protein C4326_03390 [Ignavibacteria bacterium]